MTILFALYSFELRNSIRQKKEKIQKNCDFLQSFLCNVNISENYQNIEILVLKYEPLLTYFMNGN